MQIVNEIGNRTLKEREKTLFLSSKRAPISLYDIIFDWVDSLTKEDCVVCFNTSELESEVMKALLVNGIPTILVVMNAFTDRHNVQIQKALQEDRILIVVLKRDEERGKGQTPRLRNEFVMGKVEHIVCGYIDRNGSIFPLLAGKENVRFLEEEQFFGVSEDFVPTHQRWKVWEDKTLLWMFYEDMGIHAIKKRLNRTYLSVHTRTRAITMPEEVLKGREFEDFVLELFDLGDSKAYSLIEWRGDKSNGNISPVNNTYPDFVIEYKKDNIKKRFAVECKWRAKLKADLSKDLFPTDRIENYQLFSESRNMPVTIILGVGGEPGSPDLIYRIPLECMSSIISGAVSITRFLFQGHTFDAATFIRQKESKGKAYTMEEKRKQYPNAYKPWTPADDNHLIALHNDGKSTKELASIFGRKEGAIRSRIKKLLEANIGEQ